MPSTKAKGATHGAWYSFNDQMNAMFGGKVYRLCLSAGCTCPNRDGTLGSGGCIFCSEGSGTFAASGNDILAQIEAEETRIFKKIGSRTAFRGYMAYFQPYTNTYGDSDRLACLFETAASRPEILALSIATRPDCLKEEMIACLSRINRRKPVFVELGLQTIHEDTARYINRCYTLPVFEGAFMRLKRAGLRVVAHVIIGLPGEDAARSIQTVSYLASLSYPPQKSAASPFPLQAHLDGIKLQLLYILKDTPLAGLFPEEGTPALLRPDAFPKSWLCLTDGMELPQYTLPEYARLIRTLSGLLPADIPLHRVTGDPVRGKLIAPLWAADKKRVLNTIRAAFR